MLEAWGPFEWWGNCYCLNCRWFHHIIQMLNSLHCLSLYYVVQFHSILWTVFSSSFNLNFSNSKCVNSCFYFCMSHLLCKWLALYPNKKKYDEEKRRCKWLSVICFQTLYSVSSSLLYHAKFVQLFLQCQCFWYLPRVNAVFLWYKRQQCPDYSLVNAGTFILTRWSKGITFFLSFLIHEEVSPVIIFNVKIVV